MIQGILNINGNEINGTLTTDGVSITGKVYLGGFGIGLPAGGLAGQIFRKISDLDFDGEWVDPDAASVPIEITQRLTDLEEFQLNGTINGGIIM